MIDDSRTDFNEQLGAIYTPGKTTFKVWAPTAQNVTLNLFSDGDVNAPCEKNEYPMTKREDGVYVREVLGNLDGLYYTYTVDLGFRQNEVVDIYAVSAGVNGDRGMVVDLSTTNPKGFERDRIVKSKDKSLIPIIWEVHVRDFSIDAYAGSDAPGKFAAFSQTFQKTKGGYSALTEYLKELGVTYVHLLPIFDYATVDERGLGAVYNWGYDPKNYNVLEGSYATDPYDGKARIREFKQLVKTLHEQNIGVIMDVVYNHTYYGGDSFFNLTVPDYYFRKNGNTFLNGSGCGNETASERKMFKKYMRDSLCFWAKEYHLDGFRFDIMAIHDVDTMNMLREELDRLYEDGSGKDLLMYGEPWCCGFGGKGLIPSDIRNAKHLNERIAIFSNTARDGIKGDGGGNNSGPYSGYVSGNYRGTMSAVRSTIEGGVCGSRYGCYAEVKAPMQQIVYDSCHDGYTLFDHLQLVMRKDDHDFSKVAPEILQANKLAATIVLTSMGIPLLHAGEEFARTKQGAENSYNLGDEINRLDWKRREEQSELVSYYQGLIAIRKKISAYRDLTNQGLSDNFRWICNQEAMVFAIRGLDCDDFGWAIIAINPTEKERSFYAGDYGKRFNVVLNAEKAGLDSLYETGAEIAVASRTALIAFGNK